MVCNRSFQRRYLALDLRSLLSSWIRLFFHDFILVCIAEVIIATCVAWISFNGFRGGETGHWLCCALWLRESIITMLKSIFPALSFFARDDAFLGFLVWSFHYFVDPSQNRVVCVIFFYERIAIREEERRLLSLNLSCICLDGWFLVVNVAHSTVYEFWRLVSF